MPPLDPAAARGGAGAGSGAGGRAAGGAHDLWIEPTTFMPETGQAVGVRLRVGIDLAGEPLPRYAALIDQFVAVDAAGSQALAGRERVDPAGVLRSRGRSRQFFRCAKSLLLVGAPNEAQGDRVLGFPLELLAERNPYVSGRNEDLPIRLTFEGRPLAGALVVAVRRAQPIGRIAARSDIDGRVRLPRGAAACG